MFSICAPGHEEKDGSCYNKSDLQTIHNAVFDNDDDDTNKKKSKKNNKVELLNDLKKTFKKQCGDNEACWLDNVQVRRHFSKEKPRRLMELEKKVFKPKGTKGKYEWLSTIEIENVFNQYNVMKHNFHFISCVPSDYYTIYPWKFPTDIFDIYPKSAIIFNTDKMDEPGSHWVAVYFERTGSNTLHVDYFDSTGDPPFEDYETLLDLPVFRKWNVYSHINTKKHQHEDTECGIYAIFYIIARMQGRKRDDITRKRISDRDIHELRNVLFRPYSENF